MNEMNRREALVAMGGLAVSAVASGGTKMSAPNPDFLEIFYKCDEECWWKKVDLKVSAGEDGLISLHDSIWEGSWLGGNTQGVYDAVLYNGKYQWLKINYITNKELEFECPLSNPNYSLQLNRFWCQIYDHIKKQVFVGMSMSIPGGYNGHTYEGGHREFGKMVYQK